MRRLAALAVLVAAPLSLAAGLWFGSVSLPADEWFRALAGVLLARAGATVLMALHEPLWAARYCGHALLLYDSGRFRHGPAQDVLTQDHLEALYGCRLAPAAPTVPLLVPIR
jgi:hypothetical protein